MEIRLCDLKKKEIVNLIGGAVLGIADDFVISAETAQAKALIVRGRSRLFGLLGRQPDLVIPWECIRTFGEDTVLISAETLQECPALPPPPWKKWLEFWK